MAVGRYVIVFERRGEKENWKKAKKALKAAGIRSMKSSVWDISKSHSEMVILTRNQPITTEQTEPELSRLFLLPMLNASTNQN